jgi:hypothetical protein
MYLTITNQDTLDNLAINLVHREREVHSYQINIDNYNQMLSVLTQDDIPADLIQYAESPIEEIPHYLTLDAVQIISDYQYRKRITFLIRTETIEQSKSKRILEALKAQIPADQLDTLVADALVKLNAQSTS